MKEQYLEVGKITNVHGLHGEVRVQPWADSPEFIGQFSTLYVGKTHWPIRLLGCRSHKGMAIVKLEGLTDVNGALALRGEVLSIDRDDARLPEGSFFLADLIGLEVRDAATGEVLGSIAEVLTLPANNVYVVRGGKREILVPAVPQFVAKLDLENGFMLVNMLEGL